MDQEERFKSPENLYKLSNLLLEGRITYDDISEIIPGVLHINSMRDFSFHYISKKGANRLGYSSEELKRLGKKVLKKHQSPFTTEIIHPRIYRELKKDQNRVLLFFQDWRVNLSEPPFFFITTCKALNHTQLVSISHFPGEVEYLTKRINNLFGINRIFAKYFLGYNSLTKREKEILEYLGQEFTRREIAVKLFIDEKTVKKHCENIYRKLGTHKRTELEKIAVAFINM